MDTIPITNINGIAQAVLIFVGALLMIGALIFMYLRFWPEKKHKVDQNKDNTNQQE